MKRRPMSKDAEERRRWIEEGAHLVAPDVYRVPLPLPNDALHAVNVYVIVDGARLVLIDGGWALPAGRERLERSLELIGFGLADIDRFLVTHLHRDHYTQAIAVRRLVGSRVAVGIDERPWLELLQTTQRRGGWTRQVRQLQRAGAGGVARRLAEISSVTSSADWEVPDEWLTSGPIALERRTLHAIATPGHTRGHLIFHDQAAGLLFAGDHVLPHITPSIGLEGVDSNSPLGDYLSSLALVRAMPDARLLPAHGPAGNAVHQRVDELLWHHERRLDVSMKSVDPGGSTAFEVAGRLRWTRRERHLNELDVVSQMMAIIETAAHLDLLVERKLLAAIADGPVVRYLA